MTKHKPLCIYHGNCFDGFTAAWAVRAYFGDGNVDFHEGSYGAEPPEVTGRDVLIVDFSYKRPALEQMGKKARSIVILDHHKTAAEDLAGFPVSPFWAPQDLANRADFMVMLPIETVFDMNRSGAGITWDYLHRKERPRLVDHVEDRDLWRFKLPGTREIHAAMSAFPFDFTVWDMLIERPVAEHEIQGAGILRKHDLDVRKLVDITKRRMVIGGHDVPVGNIAPQWVSDACHLMCKGEPFAAAYYDGEDGRFFSLRSTDAGVDVSVIAKGYGGGGHRNAAGFKMPRGWEGDALREALEAMDREDAR